MANGAVDIRVTKGDPDQAVAWKNGLFDFTDAGLQTVMRQLSRWYNVDVTYEGNIPPRQFTGMIGRSLTLDQVLKGLAKERVHYQIEEGNKLIITP
jgi:transmembrane sensor